MAKRDPKTYAVEKVVDAVKVLESLEGTNFEPVSIDQIIERVGVIEGRDSKLKLDAVRRVLISLELCGWAKQTNGKWMLGAAALRLSNKYGEICLRAITQK